jgi:hypothetical protein
MPMPAYRIRRKDGMILDVHQKGVRGEVIGNVMNKR